LPLPAFRLAAKLSGCGSCSKGEACLLPSCDKCTKSLLEAVGEGASWFRLSGTGSDWRPGREESGPWRWKALVDIHAVPGFIYASRPARAGTWCQMGSADGQVSLGVSE
jgi:hypothetical protein